LQSQLELALPAVDEAEVVVRLAARIELDRPAEGVDGVIERFKRL
jgi:hypothetical protein